MNLIGFYSINFCFHKIQEAGEKVVGVLWTRIRLRVILHSEDWPCSVSEAFDAVVIQIDMRYLQVGWYRLGFYCEAVILAGNFDFTSEQILDRLIAASMSKFEFICGGAKSQ